MRLFVVEDEADIARDIAESFRAIGYVVEIATEGEDAWFRGSTEDYDAIILDLNLPQLDGLSVLQKLREEGVTCPISSSPPAMPGCSASRGSMPAPTTI